MAYHAKWIGYEEGHEGYDLDVDEDGMAHWVPRWVTDFYIRIDADALRIGDEAEGVNLFWNDIFHPKRNWVFRSSLHNAWQILRRRFVRRAK